MFSSILIFIFLGTNSDHFTYDQTWGGLITINAMNDGGADFGQVSSILTKLVRFWTGY